MTLIRSKLIDAFRDTLVVTGVSVDDTLLLPIKYFHSTKLLAVALGTTKEDVISFAPSVKYSPWEIITFYPDVSNETECNIPVGNMIPMSVLRRSCKLSVRVADKIMRYHRHSYCTETVDLRKSVDGKITTFLSLDLPMMRVLFQGETPTIDNMPLKVRKK